MTKRKIDHIVYCVPDLEESVIRFNDFLGVTPSIGGRHLLKGTKNALINLGNQCYLELLAIDHLNKNITSNRWMGIDYIKESKITRWAIQSEDLIADQKILKTYNPEMGFIEEGQRITQHNETLKWQMTIPLNKPKVELIPFVVSWKNSNHHPTDKMEEKCSLKSISFFGNNKLNQSFKDLTLPYKISPSSNVKITATINGPKGDITI